MTPKMDDTQPTGHKHQDHRLHYLLLGTALAIGGVILAPAILPALGFGDYERSSEISSVLTHDATGLPKLINAGLSSIPLIGKALASGGMWTAAAAGALGIGGYLLGRYLEKKHDGSKDINWGKIIKYGAMITSALIALPSVLSSISIGISYIAYAYTGDINVIETVAEHLEKFPGFIGDHHASGVLAGVFSALPHILTCGLPLAPVFMSMFMGEEKKDGFVESVQNNARSIQQKYTDGSVIAEMKLDKPLEANQPCTAKLTLRHANGRPLSPDELAVVHTEKLHLFVADSSLKDYRHIHPQPTGEAGEFSCSFTPATSNSYSAWADFTLLKNGQNHKLKTELPAASGRTIAPAIRANTHAEKRALSFDWKSSEPLRKDAPSIVEVNVSDASGQPINDLEPVMGAFAHLVGFSKDGKSIIHTHPMGAEPTDASERGGPRLRFHVEPDCSGATQFYLQVRRGGEDIFVPFGQQIQPPALASQRIAHQHHSLAHG